MFGLTRRGRAQKHQVEDEKIARLVKAERELEDLQKRSMRAVSALDSRQARNHWREAVQQMITGAL